MNSVSKTNWVARLGGVAMVLIFSCCNPTSASEAKGHGDPHVAKETSREATNGVASSRNPAAHPEANKVAAVPSPVEVNPALRDASDDLVTTNLVEKQQATVPGSSKQADLDAMLEWARRMKREKNFEAAEKSCRP